MATQNASNSASIAGHCRDCVEGFQKLKSILDEQDSGAFTIKSSEVADELSRFQIWAGNLGAQQPRSLESSLEHRVRDAPKLKKQIVELLGDLEEALLDGMCALR